MLSRARDHVGWPVLVVLALLALAPLVITGATLQSVLVEAMIYATGAVGLDVLTGYSGQYSFGQFVYFAVGAYVMSALVLHAGLPWWGALLVAVASAGILAGVIAAALVRLKFFGAAVGTFFMGAAAVDILNGNRLAAWLGGASGIPAPAPSLGSVSLTEGMGLYYSALIALVIAAAVALRYIRVRVGTAARVVKENETVAAAMGVRVAREKIRAHVLAGVLAGLGGCMLAIDIGFLSPDTFSVNQSIYLFAIVAVGGLGSIAGPIVGAVFFFVIINALSSGATSSSSGFIFALLLLGAVVLFQGGLYDLGEQVLRHGRRWVGLAWGGRGPVLPGALPALSAWRRPSPDPLSAAAEPDRVVRGDLAAGAPLLEVTDLSVRFGGVSALSDVSLTVRAGEIHAIIGPNGAGKTTLLNCISGIQAPATGTVQLGGRPLGALPVSSRRRAGIARTFQHPSLVADLSVLDNVTIGAFESQDGTVWTELVGTPEKRRRQRVARARAVRALDTLEFPRRRWSTQAGDLTMGEQKHVDIARAIGARPVLLLLDEPTAGLGAEEVAAVARAVKSVQASGVSILVIAHHVGFVRQVADRCTVLDFGRVIATGTPEEALGDERVTEVFLGGDQKQGEAAASLETVAEAVVLGSADRPVAVREPGPVDGTAAGLVVEDLSVQISGARIIEGLSLSVGKGEIVGLAGRNGAGKTTTLRAISALESRGRGRITLAGVPLPNSPDAVARMGVSHVPEGRGIFADLTVEENIRLGLVGRGEPDPVLRRRLEAAFPALEKLKHQKAGRLSGGEQQMIALYRGLISRPRILLVDEMSLGLSPRVLKMAMELMATIGRSEGIGVLVVDQNVRMLSEYCDRMYLLKDGRVGPWAEAVDLASAYFEV
jgi:branched-chain amino acid transport system permease protein